MYPPYQDNLISERLVTRFLTEDDYTAWEEFVNDKDCLEFFSEVNHPTSAERSKFFVGKSLDRYRENRFGLQALIDKNTNELVGMSGLLSQNVNGVMEIEIGYHLLKKHWRKGYAIEAANLFKQYVIDNNIAKSIVSIIHVNNINSKNVALKNGMLPDGEVEFYGDPHIVYRIHL